MASINKKNLALGDKSKFQLVLVGYDRSEKGHKDYVKNGGGSWPAVKLADKDAVKELAGVVEFLPSLVMVKADGTKVSDDRAEVLKKLEDLAGGS